MTTYLSVQQLNQMQQMKLGLDSGLKNTVLKDTTIRENGNRLYVRWYYWNVHLLRDDNGITVG